MNRNNGNRHLLSLDVMSVTLNRQSDRQIGTHLKVSELSNYCMDFALNEGQLDSPPEPIEKRVPIR